MLIIKDSKIRLYDFRGYDSSDYCENNGNYYDWVTIQSVPGGFLVTNHTSGEFCPYCRSFDCSESCDMAEEARNELHSYSEVRKLIMNFWESCKGLPDDFAITGVIVK